MAAFVQSAGASTGGSQSATLAKAFTSNNAAGNLLICVTRNFRTAAGTISSVTDSNGNTWVQAPGGYQSNSNANDIQLWYALNCNAGANTVTLTSSTSNTFIRFCIAEYSGILTSSAYDVNTHFQGNSTSFDSHSATTTATDLLIGFVQNDTSDSFTYTASGWNFRQADPSGNINLFDKLDQPAGTYNFTGTVSSTALWSATEYAFKEATSAASQGSVVVIMQ